MTEEAKPQIAYKSLRVEVSLSEWDELQAANQRLAARLERVTAALKASNSFIDWWLRTSYHEQIKAGDAKIAEAKALRNEARQVLALEAPDAAGR